MIPRSFLSRASHQDNFTQFSFKWPVSLQYWQVKAGSNEPSTSWGQLRWMCLPQVGLASIATRRIVWFGVLAYVEATCHSLGDGLNQEFWLRKLVQLLILSLQAAYVWGLFVNSDFASVRNSWTICVPQLPQKSHTWVKPLPMMCGNLFFLNPLLTTKHHSQTAPRIA